MDQTKKNKLFMLEYYAASSGKKKTEKWMDKYIADEKLKSHIRFMENAFPEYEVVPDEIIAEGDRVFVRASVKAVHSGEVDGIPPTFKDINVPFAIGYRIKDRKVVDFWTISDQMEFLEQLGMAREQVEVTPGE